MPANAGLNNCCQQMQVTFPAKQHCHQMQKASPAETNALPQKDKLSAEAIPARRLSLFAGAAFCGDCTIPAETALPAESHFCRRRFLLLREPLFAGIAQFLQKPTCPQIVTSAGAAFCGDNFCGSCNIPAGGIVVCRRFCGRSDSLQELCLLCCNQLL